MQKDLVLKVYNSLGPSRAIIDQHDFESGLPLLGEIISNMGKADLLVIFLTDDSLNSKWVREEIQIAQSLFDSGKANNILPILADHSINNNDHRIPGWLKSYLLKQLTEPYLISKKIKQKLRELLLENNPNYVDKETLFVGRTKLIDSFEAHLFTVKNTKPSIAIISGIPGVGRRTFLTKALRWVSEIKDNYEPIQLTLESKDSIEDFIIKLQDLDNINASDYIENLLLAEFEDKIEEAKNILSRIASNQEVIFVIDSGCIVRPNSQIADWFISLIENVSIRKPFALNIISNFRVSRKVLIDNAEFFEINVPALSPGDVEKLFAKYASLLKIELKKEQSTEILELLNGTPSQIHLAVEYIAKNGIRETLKNKGEILKYGEGQVFHLIDLVKQKGNKAFDIIALLSKFEFISYDLLFDIIEESDQTNNILEYLYILGIYDLIGSNKEYIKLHYAVSDYLNRSKVRVPDTYNEKMKKSIAKFVNDPIISESQSDISFLLFNIKGALVSGAKIPTKYYIPSFILKTVVELYYLAQYNNVINLIDNILESKSRLDEDLIREFRYWLCLSLARMKSDRFEDVVKHIDGSDYYFLTGFANRFLKNFDRAEKSFEIAIKKNPNSQKAKRELVTIHLLKREYQKALALSKENFESSPFNALHIQAYFICLIRKQLISYEDRENLKKLIHNIDRSLDIKAKEIKDVMNAEYAFYVEKDFSRALLLLGECQKKHRNQYYAYRALEDIYTRNNLYKPLNDIRVNMAKIENDFE